MASPRTRISTTFSLCLALLLCASASRAGNLYFSAAGGISAESGQASGTNTTPVVFDLSGDDSDASPIIGGTFGFEFPLDQALPWELPLPRWLGGGESENFFFPSWNVRAELDGSYGRGSELRTEGFSPLTPFHSEVTSWTLLHNVWLDVPVHPMVESLFGRVPVLEHLSVYLGVGLGMAGNDLLVSDTISTGEGTTYSFAWQAGGGLSYALTEWAHLDLGYRYLDLGGAEVELEDTVGDPVGDFRMDLTSHEFTTSLRFNFYEVPWPHYRR